MVYVAAAAAMPLQGLLYLFTHPRLWPTFLCVAAVAISICILVIAGLGVAMPFIAFGLESVGCPGWLAWIVSVVIMLLGSALAAVLCVTVAFGCVQQHVMHNVLVAEGVVDRLSRSGYDEPTCMRDCSRNIVWILVRLVVLIVMLPINLIPYFGQVVYFQVNGFLYAWQLHDEFLSRMGMPTWKSQKAYVTKRFAAYASFGGIALALELLLPVINVLFIFGSTAGAALLAKYMLDEDEQAARARNEEGGLLLDTEDGPSVPRHPSDAPPPYVKFADDGGFD